MGRIRFVTLGLALLVSSIPATRPEHGPWAAAAAGTPSADTAGVNAGAAGSDTMSEAIARALGTGAVERVSAERVQQPSLEYVLGVSPERLGQGYLAIQSDLFSVEMVRDGHAGTLILGLDDFTAEIDSANAGEWAEALGRRLATYTAAITQRGFRQVAGRYDASKGAACLYAQGPVIFEQDGCSLRVRVTPSPPDTTSLTHPGVVVESAVVIENGMDPTQFFVGKVAGGKIELKDGGRCRIVLATR